jgi:divalent metal cation (Fe/Co/Zn/Cd) transporter
MRSKTCSLNDASHAKVKSFSICPAPVSVRVGKQHNSSVVVLNAWHHRVDGLTSLIALAGIGGAMIGFPLADPIAGLLVAGMIVKLGLQSGVDSFRDLTDRQVDGATRAELEALLGQQRGDGVQSYHKLRLRRTGARCAASAVHSCKSYA